MSKELDELLSSLLKEIPVQEETPPPEPPKPTKEAFQQAERIAQDVEQDKSWQIPPDPPKVEIPAPQHEPVVVPPPISHFTDVPSANPAIRMRDRLDETALPKPDIERKPTQIMKAKPTRPDPRRKKKRRKSGTASEDVQRISAHPAGKTAPDEKSKRKIPHITVPDELPPDEGTPTISEQRQETVRSRAEQIREQLRKRSEEAADTSLPAEPDTASESTGTDAVTASVPEQPEKLFAEEKPKPEKLPSEAPEQNASVLRHLNKPEEPRKPAKFSFFGRFRQKKEKKTAEESNSEDDASTDWRTLVKRPYGDTIREIINEEADKTLNEFPKIVTLPEEPPETSPISEPAAPETDSEEQPEEVSEEIAEENPEEALPEEKVAEEELPEKEVSEELPETETPTIAIPETPSPHSVAAALREAFDETAEELAEMKAEPLPEQGETVRIHFLKRHSYFFAGIVCFVLALVGLVTCIRWGWDKVQNFAGSASLRQTLEEVLYPIAVVDLPAFEAPGELDAGSLLAAAMVDILMYDDVSGYPENFDVISIPAGDVLARAQTMFGTEFRTEFSTLHAAGETFFYDAESGCYNVPSDPVIFSYSPEVTDIQRDGDTCIVTVLYHSDLAKWQERSENFDGGSEKTMQVTLVQSGDSYQITKIANVQTGNGE